MDFQERDLKLEKQRKYDSKVKKVKITKAFGLYAISQEAKSILDDFFIAGIEHKSKSHRKQKSECSKLVSIVNDSDRSETKLNDKNVDWVIFGLEDDCFSEDVAKKLQDKLRKQKKNVAEMKWRIEYIRVCLLFDAIIHKCGKKAIKKEHEFLYNICNKGIEKSLYDFYTKKGKESKPLSKKEEEKQRLFYTIAGFAIDELLRNHNLSLNTAVRNAWNIWFRKKKIGILSGTDRYNYKRQYSSKSVQNDPTVKYVYKSLQAKNYKEDFASLREKTVGNDIGDACVHIPEARKLYMNAKMMRNSYRLDSISSKTSRRKKSHNNKEWVLQ